jgi:hypothetical protein
MGSAALAITAGEFPSATDRPELGQDEGPWEGEIAAPDDSAEFARSITLDDPASRSCAAILVFPGDSRSFGNEGWPDLIESAGDPQNDPVTDNTRSRS